MTDTLIRCRVLAGFSVIRRCIIIAVTINLMITMLRKPFVHRKCGSHGKRKAALQLLPDLIQIHYTGIGCAPPGIGIHGHRILYADMFDDLCHTCVFYSPCNKPLHPYSRVIARTSSRITWSPVSLFVMMITPLPISAKDTA